MLTPDFTHLIFGPLRTISLFTFWMETRWATGGLKSWGKLSRDRRFCITGKWLNFSHQNSVTYFRLFETFWQNLRKIDLPGGSRRCFSNETFRNSKHMNFSDMNFS